MSSQSSLYPRHMAAALKDALAAEPVVLVNGPRQCGKTTLTRMVGEAAGYGYYTLDDEDVFQMAQRDPKGFVQGMDGPTILDEVQRLPGILRSLKVVVDRERRPGRFLLTGSANILQMPETSESLAGRMRTLRLHPLSQSELEGTEPHFLDRLFAADFKTRSVGTAAAEEPDYAETGVRVGAAVYGKPTLSVTDRIVAGGYPVALAHTTEANRTAWYRDYATSLIERDAVEMAQIRDAQALSGLLELMAAYTAQQPRIRQLAQVLDIDRRTATDYVTLLKRMFLLKSLPPWHHEAMERMARTHKLHIGDTGLACALLGLDANALRRDPSRRGWLLETFALQELRRQANAPHRFFHYRSSDRREVDIVIQRSVNSFAGVEVKSAGTLRPEHFQGLERMRDALGRQFACGIVLYEGNQCGPWGDRLFGVPIQMLWESSGEDR